MNPIEEVLINTLNSELKQIVISNPRDKEHYTKIKIRPISHKGGLAFHVEKFTNTQVFHDNLDKEGCITAITGFAREFQQLQIYAKDFNYSVLISKKGKVSISKKKAKQQKVQIEQKEQKEQEESKTREKLSHNKKKKYILEEGVPIPFLVDLGVMTKEGKVVNSKYDKFRQINRFLEFIQDIMPKLEIDLEVDGDKGTNRDKDTDGDKDTDRDRDRDRDKDTDGDREVDRDRNIDRDTDRDAGIDRDRNIVREVKVIDIGCGKSTLTFAVYYYLRVIRGVDVSILGIDLKEEVIDRCNDLAKQYGYSKLVFQKGDISNFQLPEDTTVDMVMSLHACDTATDIALAKGISWNAKVILAVPCCQKELNRQIKNQSLQPLLKYGLLKERFSSLVTDSIRGGYLEAAGYKVQMLDFVDMEHTPKNLLIRGIKEGQTDSNKAAKIQEFEKFLNIESTMGRLSH
jgi:SAM-dependent methyltransferase